MARLSARKNNSMKNRKSIKAASPRTDFARVTGAVPKLLEANWNEPATSSANEALSRTDRFFITAMLGNGWPSRVALSENTIIGGSSVGSIMELGRCDLFNNLKLENPFQSLHLVHLLNLQKIVWQCLDEIQKNTKELHARDINLRYGSKAVDTFVQVYDRLESCWTLRSFFPLGERVLVPLSPNTLVERLTHEDKPTTLVGGVTLQELMEWCGVQGYLSLRPQDPFESILADLIIRTHRAGRYCCEQADWWRFKPEVIEINFKYALKLIDSSDRLLARLEGYRAKHIQRVLPNSATGKQKLGDVASSKFDRHPKKQDKARVHFNGNGKHP
jgi:hypothetical protein